MGTLSTMMMMMMMMMLLLVSLGKRYNGQENDHLILLTGPE